MKKENLIFKNDSKHIHDTFIKSCLFNCLTADDEYKEFLTETLEKANNTEEFTEMFLANKKYKHKQGYQVLLRSEKPDQVWYFIRENFGDKCFKTMSDVGGVMVGNDDFSIIVPNGYGDGTTRVAVFDKGEFYVDNLMQFFTSISGKFAIYGYDCDGAPETELDGRYGIYYYDGLVAFVKWN